MPAANSDRRLLQLFEAACDVPRDRRAAFLDDACADDPALRTRVEAMLSDLDDGDTDAGLPVPFVATSSTHRAGERIGAYEVVGEIGEGGMGVVYLAGRADGRFKKQVALKLIRQGRFASEAQRRRFLREQRVLGRLDHPHIARMLDAGVTNEGVPYYVMEYVEGLPIDQYASTQRLSLDARLRLFVAVGEAVQYAHTRLILHRDLKPSNILVTREGQVKLLDFGIAKLLEEEEEEDAPITRTGERLLTPEYAAPEQIRNEPVGAAADVYALGVVLYELLTGQRPYTFEKRTPTEIERVICEQVPARPSDVVTRNRTGTAGAKSDAQTQNAQAVTHRGGADQRRRRLRGDVDTIVLKALHKEPARRYRSVGEFAEDVQRHLNELPVTARPDTAAYRVGKFMRRHAAGVAVAAGLVLLLVGFGVFYTVRVTQERDRAEGEAAKAEEVTEFLVGLFEASDPFAATDPGMRGDSITALELLERGRQEIEALAGQPGVQAQMLNALGRVYTGLGQYEQADSLLRQALAASRAAHGEEHEDVAQNLFDIGTVFYHQGHYDEADSVIRKALALQRELHAESNLNVARSVSGLATIQRMRGKYEDAERLYREAIEHYYAIHSRDEKHPNVAEAKQGLAVILYIKGALDEAEALFREVLAAYSETSDVAYLNRLEVSNNLAMLLQDKGEYENAEAMLREALESFRNLLGSNHPQIITSWVNLGGVLGAQGKYDKAEQIYQRAVTMTRQQYGAKHMKVALILNNLVSVHFYKREYDETESVARETLHILRKHLEGKHPSTLLAIHNLAMVLEAQKEYEEAISMHQEILAERRNIFDDESVEIGMSLNSLARLIGHLGNNVRADSMQQEALSAYTSVLPNGHWQIADANSQHAGFLIELGRLEEAETKLLESYRNLVGQPGPAERSLERTIERLVNLYEAWNKPEEAAAWEARLPEDPAETAVAAGT